MTARVLGRAIFLVAATVAPPAQALGGSGTLRGAGRFTVQRCHGFRDQVTGTVTLAADGTWSASVTGGSFDGTWTTDSGRRYELSFSAPAEAAFVASLASDASQLCRTSVTVTSVTRDDFSLTVNRRLTKARLLLRYEATGSGGGRSGRARYLLKLHGRWTAG
jgi:hypothetical protein